MASKSTDTVVQRTELPGWIDQFGKENLALADALSRREHDVYTAPRLADFTDDTKAAFDAIRSLPTQAGGHGVASSIARDYRAPTVDAASGEAAQLARSAVRDVTGQGFLDADVGAYLNPFEDTVVAGTMGDMARAHAQELNRIGAGAAAAGAFGGSRHGLLEAEAGRNYLDRLGATVGNLRFGGYTQAQDVIGRDQDRKLQGDLANQQMDYGVGTFNVGQENAMRQLNASLAQQAALQNAANDLAAQGVRLDAAGTMGRLADQNLGRSLTAANALSGIGEAQRGMDQANLDLAYDDFLRQQAYPQEMLNLRLATLAGTPYGSATYRPVFSNPASDAISGALSGARTGAAISSSPWGIGIGAGLGLLGGLLG